MKRKRTITYWEFVVTIVGPRYETKVQRQQARKLLPKKKLKQIELAAWLATQAKLPTGFRAKLS